MTAKRVLFVDDEAHILQGLRRMLRPFRQDWDLAFAPGGSEALDQLADAPCDVLVSDMRMPGMDGVTLLNTVRNRHPSVVRIVLSGQADRASTTAAVGPAHQYLSKPCDAETLRDTIDRALALREHIASDAVRRIVSAVDALPSAPSVYLELTRELESDAGSATRVADIIAGDPALTAKILQVVNSAFFGLRRDIVSPLDAVRLLGFELIQSLVLAAGVMGRAADSRLTPVAEGLWRHSVTTAAHAKTIARTEGSDPKTAGLVMTAGLLHDVGKLVFATCLGDDYLTRLRDTDASAPLWQRETDHYGTTHAAVGGYLLSLWGLPDRLVELVAFHHEPHNGESQGFTPLAAVIAANSMAQGAPNDPDDGTPAATTYLERCGLADRLETWQAACLTAEGERT